MPTEKVVQLLEEQLTYMKQQNGDLSNQNKDLLKRIEVLTEQIHQLTKALYRSKMEKSQTENPVNRMPTIGCSEAYQAKDQSSSCFKVPYQEVVLF